MFEQAFKSIDDVLWKEAGCTTELDYTEQTSWLLFLKYLDGFEQDRAYLFLIDPARRQRIKLWGRAHVVENDTALVERLFDKGYKAKPERAILFTIEAWDVNCSAHIVTRFTEAEIAEALDTVQAKIAQLEAENARLRALIAKQSGTSP